MKSGIELKYLKEFSLGNTKLTFAEWLKNKIKIYSEELEKQCETSFENKKEVQEFQLGDTAYMIDEDYKFFESEVYRIELKNGKYCYETRDCDFELKDICDWVFKSEFYRQLHLESMM